MQCMKAPVEDLDKLRTELVELRTQREELILELGHIAQENNDLREKELICKQKSVNLATFAL